MNLSFYLNGTPVELDIPPLTRLSDILRDEFDLITDSAGRSIVLLDSEPVYSCLQPAFQIRDRQVVTFEGFYGTPDCDDIETAFRDAGFHPCFVHRPEYIFLVHSLLEKVSHPGELETAMMFSGFHPVCGGYSALLEAVKKATQRRFIRHNEQTR